MRAHRWRVSPPPHRIAYPYNDGMRPSYITRIWHSIADRGRILLGHHVERPTDLRGLCRELLSEKGEASGTAIARDVVDAYQSMSEAEKLDFFTLLATEFSPDVDKVLQAAQAYHAAPNPDTLAMILEVVEPPRQELIRRINLAPEGTAAILAMRGDLLRCLPDHPKLRAVDADMQHLLRSWFNRGFLALKRIDWSTPAATLETLFKHEAVHAIQGWSDMRRRLEEDRRCFAFFHQALPDPLIFVEVALLEDVPQAIGPLLDREVPPQDTSTARTAVFYSINNCQDGLRGISLGHFLIKQVVSDLLIEQPQLKTFVTLSPVPGFRTWLRSLAGDSDPEVNQQIELLATLHDPNWYQQDQLAEALKGPLLRLCARFLLEGSADGGTPDPVAAFHLGNGASVDRINWLADTSARRMRQSAGIMVNYAYHLSRIEKNHEDYVKRGTIAVSGAVRGLRKQK